MMNMVDEEDVNKDIKSGRPVKQEVRRERGAFWDCLSILSAEIGEEKREESFIINPLNEAT